LEDSGKEAPFQVSGTRELVEKVALTMPQSSASLEKQVKFLEREGSEI